MTDWKEALEYLETRCDPDSKAPATIRAHIEGLEANLRNLSPLNYEERCRLRDAEARVRELEDLLRDCLPYVSSMVQASHLTDGFTPKPANEHDRLAARIAAVDSAREGE